MKNVNNFDEFNQVNEARYGMKPTDILQQHFKEAFVYMWDELGMELTVESFRKYLEEASKNFDIRKFVDWGKIIPEK